MEYFIRIAFWIVSLSGCLLAPISDSNIDIMNATVTCQEDSTFYTPVNVKPECITKALECFKTELNGTVKAECEHTKRSINQAIVYLETVIAEQSSNEFSDANSTECACESWQPASFSKFLDGMKSLIQQINAVA